MTETTPTAKHPSDRGLLDDIEVQKPENSAAKSRLYLCGIRRAERDAEGNVIPGHERFAELERFEFQFGVGPASFCTRTFSWDGQGENATQVFHAGAIQPFTDSDVALIRGKLPFLYLRKIYGKDREGRKYVSGVQVVEASDGGDYACYKAIPGENGKPGLELGQKRSPIRLPGRLAPGDEPLRDYLIFAPVYGDRLKPVAIFTRDELQKMLAEADAEEKRELEAEGATFVADAEAGRGGKLEKKVAAPRDPRLAKHATTTTEGAQGRAGYIPGQ